MTVHPAKALTLVMACLPDPQQIEDIRISEALEFNYRGREYVVNESLEVATRYHYMIDNETIFLTALLRLKHSVTHGTT